MFPVLPRGPLFETRCSRLFSGVQWKYYSMKSPEAWLRLRFNRIHHAGFTFGVRSVEVGLDQFSCHTTSLRMDWANTRTHKHFLKLSYTASANAVCQSDSRRTGPAHSTQKKLKRFYESFKIFRYNHLNASFHKHKIIFDSWKKCFCYKFSQAVFDYTLIVYVENNVLFYLCK